MITEDGYAAVPWGNRFVLIYNGEQLSDHKTVKQATVAIKKHREINAPKLPSSASKKTGTRSKSKAKIDL